MSESPKKRTRLANAEERTSIKFELLDQDKDTTQERSPLAIALTKALPFCEFETLISLRVVNQNLHRGANEEMRNRTDSKHQMIYKRSKGEAVGGFELYLRPGWTDEYTSLRNLVRHTVQIPLSGPFRDRLGDMYDENKNFEYVMKHGSARTEDGDNPVRDQLGKWEFEVSYMREQDLRELLKERFPTLDVPMKTVSDLFLYFKAIGWSSIEYQQQFLDFKRYMLPLLIDAKVIGQAHIIAEHDRGGYVYKEALTFQTSTGMKYELVGIDIDYCSGDFSE